MSSSLSTQEAFPIFAFISSVFCCNFSVKRSPSSKRSSAARLVLLMDFIKFSKSLYCELSSSMPYFASHISKWRFIIVFVFMGMEHLLHHHLHEHFLHHVILRSLLLSENKLDRGYLALLCVSLLHHARGFEQFHCFEILGAFKKSMDESMWVVVHWKFNFWHVHPGTLYNCLLHFEQRCLHHVFAEA